MKAIFLSDAHLMTRESAAYRMLMRFLESLKGNASHLYLNGDIFDFWFCRNGSIYQEFRAAVDMITELNRSGISVVMLEGNHDFFLYDYFRVHDIAVVPDAAHIELGTTRIYCSHGDMVDKSNRGYLFLRKLLRSRAFYMTQRTLPPSFLWKASQLFSGLSRRQFGRVDAHLVDVMERFALRKFKEGFDAVILGHCHYPLLKRYPEESGEKVFALLGDWIEHYSYVTFEGGAFSLRRFDG